MNLRELINRLEELSNGGKNDNMPVECWSESEGDIIDMNELTLVVKSARINNFSNANEVYDYVMIVTE